LIKITGKSHQLSQAEPQRQSKRHRKTDRGGEERRNVEKVGRKGREMTKPAGEQAKLPP